MQVKIVSITKSLIEEKELTAEELIVYIARVSNPSNQMNSETSDKLINYLLKHKHLSPFEQAHFTVEIKTSRAIAAQILRHWSMRFQEFSQRYAEVVELEPIQLRKQGVTNRQSSEEEFDPEFDFWPIHKDWNNNEKASRFINDYLDYGVQLYKKLLKEGVAKECARMILPMTTQTTIYVTGNIRDWIFYLRQRTDSHAQLEHRDVANEVQRLFKENFPMISKALEL